MRSLRAMCCVWLLALAAHGQQENKTGVTAPEPVKQVTPSVYPVPLLAQPLRLADFPEMAPTPAVREHLTQISTFIQNQPFDGRESSEKTEVWIGRTHTSIYFVFVCHDRHAALVRGHLARRENILQDDRVSVLLDTFQDRRHGILFSVNPAGVQADAAWSDSSDPDYSYDAVWDSDGRVTKDGWMGLIAIPFRSLRFPPNRPDWGVVVYRAFPRNSEFDYWPRVAAGISGTLSQEGTLHEIEGGHAAHNLQVNPYVLAQGERTLQDLDPLHPYFSKRELEGTAGGEVKAVLKDSIVLDATVNPDFSDVESDQPKLTVNQRYSVYFPELRPFFLENANYFNSPNQLVYTRNIVHPEYGVRVTGKVGRTNLGLLLTDDRYPGEAPPAGDPARGKRALFGVGRVSEDVGKNSSVGLLYTDKEFAGSWNRVGGVDFTARLNNHWTSYGQALLSSTRHRDGSYAAGPAHYLEFTRNGHAFNLDSNYQDFSTHFETQVGFVPTTNVRNDHTHTEYQWYPTHSVVQSIGLEGDVQVAFDHQGNRVYRYTTFDPFFLLPRNIVLAPLFGANSDTLGPQNGLPLTRNFSENFVGFVARGAPFAQLNYRITATYGGNVNYNPVTGALPSLMNEENVQALVTVQPFRSLTLDNTYLLDRNHARPGGADVFENQTLRTKINYQFTRALSARVIVQYDSVLVNPLETSLQRTKHVSTEALLTWLPHPGTAIYVGYNNDLENLSRSLCNRGPDGTCDPNNTTVPRSSQYLHDGRQIFVKASYLLRF